ncbi:MAG: FAD-dependent oxidoreductase [Clostridia bacterium]|nr:FAD-dependent oxidoreductase [Clostridia bacterium]
MEMINFTREIPLRYSCDVCVIGGGMAGVAAAVCAAWEGASVILADRFGSLGGNATVGGVANFSGNTLGRGRFFDEVLKRLDDVGAIAPYVQGKERVFNHHYLGIILQEIALEAGVKLLLHTKLCDILCEGRIVRHAILSGASGMEALSAKVFIDCTGDGCVARFAGFRTMKGDAGGAQLPMSEMYFVREVGSDQLLSNLPALKHYETKADLPMTTVWPDGPGSYAIKLKVPRFDSTDTESLTAAEIEARRRAMAVMEYHRRVENRNWNFDGMSPIIGIREGVRIVGDHILTVDELREGKNFATAIACGDYPLDGHDPRDDGRTYILPKEQRYVPKYQIPAECLVAADADNLLMAGRCISADQLALSSARVMPVCAMTGAAAGHIAARALSHSGRIRRVNFCEIRKKFSKEGADLAK